MTHWLTEGDDMLSDEMLNEIRKNAAANGRLITVLLAAISLCLGLHLTALIVALAVGAAYFADVLTLMRQPALAVICGAACPMLTIAAFVHLAIAILF